MAAVTIHSNFGAQEKKICHYFHFSPSICHEVMGLSAMILVFWILSFKPIFSLSSFTLIKKLFGFSSLSVIRVVSSAYLGCWHFSQQSWFQLVIHPAQHFTWCILHIRVTIFSFVMCLSQFGTSPLFKWALGSITKKKASGSDEIPADLFWILKDEAVKVLYSICQQIWKTQQWPQNWKRSVFIPTPLRERMFKLLHNCTHFSR